MKTKELKASWKGFKMHPIYLAWNQCFWSLDAPVCIAVLLKDIFRYFIGLSGSARYRQSLRHVVYYHSSAMARIYLHCGNIGVLDVLMAVHVEHREVGHLARGAARSGSSVGKVSYRLNDVSVGVFKHVHPWAFSLAIIGVVTPRGNDPVPTDFLEVDHHGVPATWSYLGVGGAYHIPICASLESVKTFLGDAHHHERSLREITKHQKSKRYFVIYEKHVAINVSLRINQWNNISSDLFKIARSQYENQSDVRLTTHTHS